MTTYEPKTIVEAHYNSGVYVGEVVEDRRNFALVKVLAVLKHPDQGDLHKPGQVEGIAFFERKALAHQELVNVQKRKVYPYTGNIPNYDETLKQSFSQLTEALTKEDTSFTTASLERLNDSEIPNY